jgi:hypothetical protein
MPRNIPGPLASSVGVTLIACSMPSTDIGTTTPAAADKPPSKAPTRTRSGPAVIDAELTGEGDRLRLRFSEPLASTEGVDPNDFRLSFAMAYTYRAYAYAYYYDLGDFDSDADGDTDGDALLEFTGMTSRGETLELELSSAIPLDYCHEIALEVAELNREPGIRAKGGIFLHYAPGELPITNAGGRALAPVAAEWVLRKRRGDDEADSMYFEGAPARRALREPIPVRCGPVLPPGPV